MGYQAVVRLTSEDLDLLADALEYWDLGDVLPRNNGEVFIPGDLRPEDDRYWGPEPQPSAAEADTIEQVRRCRELADRLRSVELTDMIEE